MLFFWLCFVHFCFVFSIFFQTLTFHLPFFKPVFFQLLLKDCYVISFVCLLEQSRLQLIFVVAMPNCILEQKRSRCIQILYEARSNVLVTKFRSEGRIRIQLCWYYIPLRSGIMHIIYAVSFFSQRQRQSDEMVMVPVLYVCKLYYVCIYIYSIIYIHMCVYTYIQYVVCARANVHSMYT